MTNQETLPTTAAIAHARETDRGPTVHRLKCWPQFFDAIAEGRKRHDLRRSHDRDFRTGDRMLLEEFDPDAPRPTGRTQVVEITYITSAQQPCALSEAALHPDFCILSIVSIGRH